MKLWGLLTSVDLWDCDPDTVRNPNTIEKFVVKLCDLIDMKRYGPCQLVRFGEDPRVSGYSMTQLIETSLISGHFVDLTNAAYIDIFSCKLYDPDVVHEFTKNWFKAKESSITVTNRYEKAGLKIQAA